MMTLVLVITSPVLVTVTLVLAAMTLVPAMVLIGLVVTQ